MSQRRGFGISRFGSKFVGALTGCAAVAGILVGCSDDDAPGLDYVVDARLSTYNANTVVGNADGVLMATTRVLPGFSYLGAAGQVTPDLDTGTVTQLPGENLTLRYDFAPQARFSDGKALDCDDMVLAWAAMSGRVPGFHAASRAGYRDIERVDCAPGDKSATVTFAPGRGYQDWQALFGAGVLMPAHVVARDAGIADVIAPIRAMDRPTLGRVSRSWNEGFNLAPGEFEEARFPSAGPFRISDYTDDGALVLVPNDEWWGERPRLDRINMWGRHSDLDTRIADGQFQVYDGTADLISGDEQGEGADSDARRGPSRDVGNPAQALGVEQLVLSGGGVFGDPRLRRAFASCVPRDGLAREFGRGAQMWNIRSLSPGDTLAKQVNQEFGPAYVRPDPNRARGLIAEADAEPVQVRVGYRAPTARWQQMVAAIAAACAPVGVEVVDVGGPDVGPWSLGVDADALVVVNGAAMSASGAADPVRDAYQLRARDPLNRSGFDEEAVNEALDELAVTADTAGKLGLVRTIENAAWASMPSIPLFAAPRERGWDDGLQNVVPGLGRSGIGWNMDRWAQS